MTPSKLILFRIANLTICRIPYSAYLLRRLLVNVLILKKPEGERYGATSGGFKRYLFMVRSDKDRFSTASNFYRLDILKRP